MKKILILGLILIPFISCNLFKTTIKVDQLISEKEKLDKMNNPARKYLMERKLKDYLLDLKGVVAKKVVESTHIDYDFCVLVDVQTPSGMVECYVYTKNIKIISELEMGKTKISVAGDFSRFFTVLDDYYIKIEIVDADISIYDEVKEKPKKDEKKEDKKTEKKEEITK